MVARQSSASSAHLWLHELLDLVGSQPTGPRGLRQCPAHPDSSPSLAIAERADGAVLLKCHAGCPTGKVLAALRIGERHLFRASPITPTRHQRLLSVAPTFPPLTPKPRSRRGLHGNGVTGYRLETAHDYDEFQLLRWRHPVTAGKHLIWERRDPAGAWIPGLGGTLLGDLPLYQERQARMAAAAGEVVVVVESESSVDALNKAGIYATTWAGGASKPNLERIARALEGANVVVIPDNDEAGLRCSRLIASHLQDRGIAVSTVLPHGPGDDARHLLHQHGPAELQRLFQRVVVQRGPLGAAAGEL